MPLTLDEAKSLVAALGVNIPEDALSKKAETENLGFSMVQLQKSRLTWDGLRKNIQSQLQALEKSILDAVRAHNSDETIEEDMTLRRVCWTHEKNDAMSIVPAADLA